MTMKNARRRARELAVQGLYQWLLTRAPAAEISIQIQSHDGFAKADTAHFTALLQGVIREAAALKADMMPFLDRPITQLSPVEYAVLLIAVFELKYHVDIPYRVVINEAIELSKIFGGVDGHKYVNGVLDKFAIHLRSATAAKLPSSSA